jgi:sterol 24-C-methyltransferase
MKPGMKALDVGCGVGGPMRNMAIFSGSQIKGVTINEYQVRIGNKYNERAGLADLCESIQGDFQNLPFENDSFDCAYAIEATCHSPNRLQCFTQVNKVLKKGGMFALYDWVVCNKYDKSNPEHVRIKEGIEVGNGLPTLVEPQVIAQNLRDAGFEILDQFDAESGVHSPHQIPWYDTLNGKMTLSGFRMTYLGRCCTHALVTTLETIRIAPKGSTRVSALLNATAKDLVEGGKLEIFTPSYFFLARKL